MCRRQRARPWRLAAPLASSWPAAGGWEALGHLVGHLAPLAAELQADTGIPTTVSSFRALSSCGTATPAIHLLIFCWLVPSRSASCSCVHRCFPSHARILSPGVILTTGYTASCHSQGAEAKSLLPTLFWLTRRCRRHTIVCVMTATQIARMQELRLELDSTPIVKTCQCCGREFTAEDWAQLEFVGVQQRRAYWLSDLECRNCVCRSTLAVEVR